MTIVPEAHITFSWNYVKHVGNIKAIWRYPVKSMAGERLPSAELGWHGIDGDRRFAFVRTGNMNVFPWLTASKMPSLIRYRPRQMEAAKGGLPIVRVEMPDGTDVEVESDSLRQHVVATHGAEVRLIGVANGIFDETPMSLISTTTIELLGAESGCSLDARQFRPNILIEPIGTDVVDENAWIGRTIVLGGRPESPSVHVAMRDVRCVIVNLDPDTAVADARIFRTIARSHDNCAGVYASVLRVGALSEGDPVYLDER